MNANLRPDNRSAKEYLATATLGVFLLAFPLPSQAAIYSFTEIDTSQGQPIDGFIDIAINDSGEVVYSAFLDNGGMGIFVGDGGQPGLIVDTSGPLRRVEFPSINDSGDVAFVADRSASSSNPNDDVVFRYNQSNGTFTEIVETGEYFNFLCCSTAINNAGAVAFSGIVPTVVAAGTGGAPLIITPEYGPTFGDIAISVNGSIFEVAYTEIIGPRNRVVKGNSLSKTTIADSAVPPFLNTTGIRHYRASINDIGEVGFSAPLSTGLEAVFIGNGASRTTVVDSSGGFDTFGRVSISRFHTVFEGRLDFTGTRGIYAGSNPIANRVVEAGNKIAGYTSPVRFAFISSASVNDFGQIAMIVNFDNEISRVMRADILGSFLSVDDLLIDRTVSAMTATRIASIRQKVDLRIGDSSSLAFDYLFATTTGRIQVRLGGRTLANIEAPRLLASQFKTVDIPVNIRRLPRHARSLPLEIVLHGGGTESGVLIDNVEFAGVVNGDFGTGDLSNWKSRVSPRHGAVGVALAPGAQTIRRTADSLAPPND